MDSYRTEEEQLEQLRQWWRDNGRSTLIMVALAVAAVFGYRAWTQQQLAQSEQASVIYQNLMLADQQLSEGLVGNEQLQTARHLAKTLREEHSGSGYSHLAALFEARLALRADESGAAEEALQWLLQQSAEDDLLQLARLRLAKVYYGRNEDQKALQTLEGADGGSYAYAYAELRGDILHAGGDVEGARKAWQEASKLAAEMERPLQNPVLQMKLNNIADAGERGEA